MIAVRCVDSIAQGQIQLVQTSAWAGLSYVTHCPCSYTI